MGLIQSPSGLPPLGNSTWEPRAGASSLQCPEGTCHAGLKDSEEARMGSKVTFCSILSVMSKVFTVRTAEGLDRTQAKDIDTNHTQWKGSRAGVFYPVFSCAIFMNIILSNMSCKWILNTDYPIFHLESHNAELYCKGSEKFCNKDFILSAKHKGSWEFILPSFPPPSIPPSPPFPLPYFISPNIPKD